ncbi:MAG: hypothetical protein LAT63_09265 [Marinobacter sp.]|nr:hypothetical protein [Marinobacter sp.]
MLPASQSMAEGAVASPVPVLAPQSVILWHRNYDSPAVRALLTLALEKTPEYGPYRIVRSIEMGQGRALLELMRNNSDLVTVANVAATLDREDDLVAIPIPIDSGLLGLRVCLVTPANQNLFEGVTSVAELRKRGLRIGQGVHWPDTGILQANDVEVITHPQFDILFRMLVNDRFECFARGVSEVLYDLDQQGSDAFIVEPHLLVAYPFPSYFFVSRADHETGQRIQLGMERAIEDGSFSEFLDDFYARPVRELGLDQRQVLTLENPFLSEESAKVVSRALQFLQQFIERHGKSTEPLNGMLEQPAVTP